MRNWQVNVRFFKYSFCLFNDSWSKSGFIARFDRIPDKFQYYRCSIAQNRTKGVSALKGLKKRPAKQPKWKRLPVQRELSHVIHWKCTHIHTQRARAVWRLISKIISSVSSNSNCISLQDMLRYFRNGLSRNYALLHITWFLPSKLNAFWKNVYIDIN